ncbi:MAG TPA: MlaA family lipoprotein [Phycisphaerae bacterium]|nr:MlaA family lipoprotein [Phycisphaerae bacterium]HRW52662.1 MlaA family lipoprotein [Phycisphaerae bacterium]
MVFKRRTGAAILIVVCIHAGGCSVPVERHDWSQYDGPGAEHFREPQYELPFHEDPLEPVNRIAFGLNTAMVVGIAAPISSGWRQIVPQEVRTPMVRAANNLEFPRRGLNNLLQGRKKEAGDEAARFAINSTAGVLGLFDVAAEKGIRAADTDTGMTLRRAGWEKSVYLTLPFGTPGTARDVVGGAGDALLDPTIYFFPAAPIKGFIQGAERMDAVERFVTTQRDAYEISKRMYLARRQANPVVSDESVERGAAAETLAYAALTPRSPEFDLRGRTHRVRIAATGRRLPYDLWMREEAAPLVVLSPGFGGHRESYANMAVAEMFHDAGFSVATFSSAANFEFMNRAASIVHPGYAPIDAADVLNAAEAVCRDIDRRYHDRVTRRVMVGVSFGGAHTLYAATLSCRHSAQAFDAYFAICPPIQFAHAAQALDDFYNAPLSFPEEERDARVIAIMRKGAALAMGGAGRVELTEAEAAFLIGLSYRMALHDVIWTARERHDTGVLKTEWNALSRASASQEIFDYSMMKYAYAFLLPELEARKGVIDRPAAMFIRSDLRLLEGPLRSRANVGVAFNANDFLMAPGDAEWLNRVFGSSRLIASERGGHLGNLGDDAWRERIIAQVNRLLGAASLDADADAGQDKVVLDEETNGRGVPR